MEKSEVIKKKKRDINHSVKIPFLFVLDIYIEFTACDKIKAVSLLWK